MVISDILCENDKQLIIISYKYRINVIKYLQRPEKYYHKQKYMNIHIKFIKFL